MTTDIFIKTYRGDFGFLRYSLTSIIKFGTGFKDIYIQAPPKDIRQIEQWTLPNQFKLIPVAEYGDGYMFQQRAKMKAHTHCTADRILFVDSDCIFFKPFNPDCFLHDEKPMLLKTKYADVGEAICWQVITEKAIGFRSEWEWMRRLPLMYNRSTLQNIEKNFPHIYDYIMKAEGRQFSEFNFIGQYIERNEAGEYEIINTADYVPPKYAEQYWSWGGMTNELENQIKKTLE